jgi:peptidoglycan/LPS O-acetylase OafA/YrhL
MLSNAGIREESARARSRPDFQPEIQGMRALSVLAVIWAHARLPGLPGGFTGVDVFFVISGFLITRLLLSELTRTGRIDLLAFWARRARRLLPNAFATLIGTVLLALFFFPGYMPDKLAREVMFAALEFANFHFADEAVDYFQSEGPASPVLHFWSLNVEEQFYMAWPPVLLGLGLWFRQRFLRAALLLLGTIWCVSFAASLYLTYDQQPFAYFGTGTRCWQLATGALLAAGWQGVERLPASVRAAMAWLGLTAILAGMVILGETARYPGAWALLPTLGATALIAGFGAASPGSLLRRGLNLPLMQWIGERSYSWYLWHWPLLALPRITYPDSPYIELLAVPASLAVACAAYAWIETPIRKGRILASRPLPTLAGAAAALAVVVGAGFLHKPLLSAVQPDIATRIDWIKEAVDARSQASKDKCLLGRSVIKQPDCLYGDVLGRRRVALFGDSHADHWFEGINRAATQNGWRLLARTKASCPSADVRVRFAGIPYTACDQWREDTLRYLTGPERPDLVILSNYLDGIGRLYDPDTQEQPSRERATALWREGFRRTIERLLAANIDVLVIRDIPRTDSRYRRCLLTKSLCETPREKSIPPAVDAEVAREFGSRVALADFTDDICGAASCSPVKGGMIIYRDSHHITASFAVSYAPQISEYLRAFDRKRELASSTKHGAVEAEMRIPLVSGSTPVQ